MNAQTMKTTLGWLIKSTKKKNGRLYSHKAFADNCSVYTEDLLKDTTSDKSSVYMGDFKQILQYRDLKEFSVYKKYVLKYTRCDEYSMYTEDFKTNTAI